MTTVQLDDEKLEKNLEEEARKMDISLTSLVHILLKGRLKEWKEINQKLKAE